MVNSAYHLKRGEQSAHIGEIETTPDEVTEGHVSLILAVMEQEYQQNGIKGLNESSWTTLLIKHANTYGMKVNREMLMENVKKREKSKKKGNFFTDLNDAIITMRTGLTQDKRIRVLDGYVV